MNKSLLTVGGVILAIVLSVVSISKPAQQVVREITAGAVSSPDILSPYFSFGGIRHWGGKMTMAQATSTFCAIQAPAATSTLVSATANFTTSSSSAQTVVIAKASTPYATTTKLGELAIAANAQGLVRATTTPTTATDWENNIIAPNAYITVGWNGALGGGVNSAPVGTCMAVFREVNF